MIPANKYRRDNLLQSPAGAILKVTKIFVTQITCVDDNGTTTSFNPEKSSWHIAITEDILSKSGFTALGNQYVHPNGFAVTWMGTYARVKLCNLSIPLYFVHQLQNAFAVTGEDLTIVI